MYHFHHFLIAFLIASINFKISASHIQTEDVWDGEVFDFIVVGAGTSGSAVTGRLVEKGYSVLLIEAGDKASPELDVPALSPKFMLDPNTTTRYLTVPQENAAQINGGIVGFLAGKTLGGTSSVNWMFINRGNPEDYNNWARLTQDQSWNYENLLKYFRKYENYAGDNPTDQRGYYGPISVSRPRYAPGVSEWIQAGSELGFSYADPNGPQRESFARVDYSQKNGRRISSYKGYIEPLLNDNRANNLRILARTNANRIIFEGKKAVGVRFTRANGSRGYARARKEIIVSAGAIGSPAILMRSGVGPKSVLDSNRIPVVKYLPVGRNLLDHVGIPNMMILGREAMAFNATKELTRETWKIYQSLGDGPYASYLGTGGQAWLTSKSLAPNEKRIGWSNIHIIAINAVDLVLYPTPPEVLASLRKGEVPVFWASIVGRPKSRGTVTLNKTNIDDLPILDFRYLTHHEDMKVMIDGIKFTLKVCEETETFRRVGCRFQPIMSLPACSRFKYRSDSYWECYARQLAGTGLHAGGTCKMGNDKDAVVDTELRVIGLDGLRVVDASIMPEITNSNTQAAVYVIAEKGADMILKSWERSQKRFGGLHS